MSFFSKKDKKPKMKKIPRDTSSDALEQGRAEKFPAHKRTDFISLYIVSKIGYNKYNSQKI